MCPTKINYRSATESSVPPLLQWEISEFCFMPPLVPSSPVSSLATPEEALLYLDESWPLPQLVSMASVPRKEFFGNRVRIHILDNIKNGHCPEDCGYCAQRKKSGSGVREYSLKNPETLWSEAQEAKAKGAYRFCMVTSGTGPSDRYTEDLAKVIKRISGELGLKVCLSAGILDEKKASVLKEAGLDRYNHNLNTSEEFYSGICTTHTFQDRIETLEAARGAGIGLCSGIIVGMGESRQAIVDVAFELRRLGVASIPVNFFIPIAGHAIANPSQLSPEFCLRVLALFRLVNPDAEIRIGAGREGHLRSLQGMALYVANSLFADGYLNVKGNSPRETLQLIADAGMVPEFSEGIPEDWGGTQKHMYDASSFPEIYKHSNETAQS